MHRLLILIVMLVSCVPSLASAQFARWRSGAQATVTMPLRALARPNSILPIEVEVSSVDPLQGEIHVVSGDLPPTVRPISVGRGSTHRVTVPVRFGDWVGDYSLTVRDDGGRWVRVDASALGVVDVFEKARRESRDGNTPSFISPEPTELPFDTVGFSERSLHVAVLGEDPLGWTLVREVDGVADGGPFSGQAARVEVVALLPTEAPSAFFGWSSADVIVWRRPDPAVLTTEQLDALLGWVAAGGRLVVSLDATYGSFRGTALAKAAGIEPVGSSLQPRVGEIARRVHPGRNFDDGELLMVDLKDRPGEFWVTEPVGAGEVTVVAFDVADAALASLDRALFWRRLLALTPTPTEYEAFVARGVFSTVGDGLFVFGGAMTEVSDGARPTAASIAGWSRLVTEELEEFEGTTPISSGALMLFGLLYLLIIGPVDWFVLRRLGRPALTWVTFPTAVLVFSGAAMFTVTAGRDGASELRCLEIVDAIPAAGMDRGSAQCSLWNAARRDLRVDPAGASGWVRFPPVDPDGYWDGPEPSSAEGMVLGGARTAGLAFEASAWSLSRLQSEWIAPNVGGGAAWNGETLRNGASAFTNSWLVVGSRLARVGPLAPGAVVSADSLAWESLPPLEDGRWSGLLRDLAIDAPGFSGALRDPRGGVGSLVGWTEPAHPPDVRGHDGLTLDVQTFRRIPLSEFAP